MEYPPNINKQRLSASIVNLTKQQASSEALQDLIDIFKQNYVSDCPHCAGSGLNLKNQTCEPCQGLGKSLGKRKAY